HRFGTETGEPMNQTQIADMANEMAGVLRQLADLQDRILIAVQMKLEAMRRCDVEGMTAAAHHEGELAAQVAALDKRRCWLGVELGKLVGMPIPPRAENVSLRSLCARLKGDAQSTLMTLGDALRMKMLKVAEANRVVELVC